MKKPEFFILILILFAGCVSTEKPISKTEIGLFTPYAFFPEILDGKLKKVVEKTYLTREADGKIVADRLLTIGDRDSIKWTNDFIATFNEDGVLLQCDQIDENGKVMSSRKLDIEGGKIIRSDLFRNDTLVSYEKVNYDGNGWINKIEVFSPSDTLRNLQEVKTDGKGNMSTVIILNSMNEITSKFEFSYNEMNKRTGYKFLNAEGIKTFEQKYIYNDHGFIERQVLIDKDGKEMESLYTYVYDNTGNWIECIGNSDTIKLLTKREIEYY